LGDPVFVQDEDKQIVPVPFALERESPLRLLERDSGPVLRGALFLTYLEHNFLRVEGRATFVSKLYGDVVVQVIVRRATANIPRTDLDSATKA
jgi:hypothetical protein